MYYCSMISEPDLQLIGFQCSVVTTLGNDQKLTHQTEQPDKKQFTTQSVHKTIHNSNTELFLPLVDFFSHTSSTAVSFFTDDWGAKNHERERKNTDWIKKILFCAFHNIVYYVSYGTKI